MASRKNPCSIPPAQRLKKQSSQVNGKIWKLFDSIKGDVDITGKTGKVIIEIHYQYDGG